MVFVHGFACDATDWQAQRDSLQARTTVVVCKLLGHGSSPDTPAYCTIDAYGAALVRAVTEQELPPAIFVGHSMGCRVVRLGRRRGGECPRRGPYATAGDPEHDA